MRLASLALVLLAACASPPARARTTPVARAALPERNERPEPSLDARFASFRLQCRDTLAPCPPSVGLLVRAEHESTQRCTVALVGPDRVITASHCLRESERRAGAHCDDTWIALPHTRSRAMEWVGCDRVERADRIDEGSVMRQDVAVLRLRHPVDRPPLLVYAVAPAEGSIVTVLAVAPHPIYDTQHELVRRLCRVASEESAVSTFGDGAARVGWLMECPSYPGNSGSPILDGDGRLRALVHAGSPSVQGVGVSSGLR